MKVFHCDRCAQLVFFENVQCLNCGCRLAYVPELKLMGSLEPAGEGLWRWSSGDGPTYRLCANNEKTGICNWASAAAEADPLCGSCRLTRLIPDLTQPGYKEAWYRLEVAKRRLVYTLQALNLPLASKLEDAERGLAFELLAPLNDGSQVFTGHKDGVITISILEANDAERERRRLELHEPYRTLLGHFRHEVGHYYWDRLIRGDNSRLQAFRQVFGDEREDYPAALQRNYQYGAPEDWQGRFVSAYASSHPWEDWAETWAHYLHMFDALETSAACGLRLRPPRADEPTLATDARGPQEHAFDPMLANWFSLAYVLNNLNRGLGLPDAYPFVLSATAIAKLRFIHQTVTAPGSHRSEATCVPGPSTASRSPRS